MSDYVIIAERLNGNMYFQYPKDITAQQAEEMAENTVCKWVMVVKGEVVGTLGMAGGKKNK